MKKILALLPPDARRALARRELRRRGLDAAPRDDAKAWLKFVPDDHLERLERLSEQYGGMSETEMPPKAREGYEQILRETLRAMKDADAADYRMGSPPRTPEEEDAVAEALLRRLEAFKALTDQEQAAHRRAEIECRRMPEPALGSVNRGCA